MGQRTGVQGGMQRSVAVPLYDRGQGGVQEHADRGRTIRSTFMAGSNLISARYTPSTAR